MKPALALSLALALGACNTVTYVNPSVPGGGQVISHRESFFLGGLIGESDIWANRECPAGVHRVESKFDVVDVLLTLITIAIYSPRSYEIYCGK